MSSGAARWTNWSGSVACRPRYSATPENETELAASISAAAARGGQVRAHGSGHSFTPLCASNDVVVNLGKINGVLAIDRATRQARVGAGTRISALGAPFHAAGLALENQGDVDVQTMAGAIGTGTHGTGRGFANLSALVASLRWIGADGKPETLTRESDTALFRAALVSFGVLGVMTEITLNLVPRYMLRERNWALDPDECRRTFSSLEREHRNIEFFWVPALDQCAMKALDIAEGPPTDDVAMKQSLAPPGTIERYLLPERVHWSHRIYPSQRTSRFNEMEFAVPLADGMECFFAVRELMQTHFREVKWAVEYRTLAQDDALLSQASGRPSVCISVHEAVGKDHEPFFRAAQSIFLSFGGRPHWGKLHYCDAKTLRSVHPHWDEFLALRAKRDPRGVFLNDYVRDLFSIA